MIDAVLSAKVLSEAADGAGTVAFAATALLKSSFATSVAEIFGTAVTRLSALAAEVPNRALHASDHDFGPPVSAKKVRFPVGSSTSPTAAPPCAYSW